MKELTKMAYYLTMLYYKLFFLIKRINEDKYWLKELNKINFDEYVRLGLICFETRDELNFRIFSFDYGYECWRFSWNYKKEKVEEAYCNLGTKYCGKLWNKYFWKGFILQ